MILQHAPCKRERGETIMGVRKGGGDYHPLEELIAEMDAVKKNTAAERNRKERFSCVSQRDMVY